MKILHFYFEMRLKKTCAAIILLIFGTTFSLNSASQIVTIPDPVFVTFLETNYPSCITGDQLDTQCPQIIAETSLTLPTDIADMYGIEFFVNLNQLHIIDALIDSLPPLPASLTYLFLNADSALVNIASLPAGLIHLFINNCISLPALPALPNGLSNIQINNNPLLTSLPDLPDALYIFECAGNNLNSIPELPEGLLYMNCSGNPNLTCLPLLPQSLHGSCSLCNIFELSGTQITCIPNRPPAPYLLWMNVPVCVDNDTVNNPNDCYAYNGINGYVYQDVNANCTYETSDLPINSAKVHLINQTGDTVSTSFTSSVGKYNFFAFTDGQYTVKLDTLNMPYMADCIYPGMDTLIDVIANSDVSNLNFSVVCKSSASNDVAVQSYGISGVVFPGTEHEVSLNAGANTALFGLACPVSTGGELIVTFAGPVTYVSPAIGALTPTSVAGNTLIYTLSDISTITPSDFAIILATDIAASSGDQICFEVSITSSVADSDLSNNILQFCYNVVNSYDPNVKDVSHKTVSPGYDDWLTYTIHFQNTGDAPAMNVKLSDTLSNLLQIHSMEVLASSHLMSTQITDHLAVFKFDGIYLPDSTTDPLGSIGFVQFRIKPLPNLPDQTVIENEAYIFFDYNAPIITNTATTSYIDDASLSEYRQENLIKVYPNPSISIFYFALPEIESSETICVQIYTMTGEKIMEMTQSNQEINQVNLQNYPEGIYILKVSTSDTNYVQRILKSN